MWTNTLKLFFLGLVVGLVWRATPATAQSCDFADGFELPGVGGSVTALAVFDDGSGPALYAGGSFTTAGSVIANAIAKWDGTQWAPLGSGMSHNRYSPVVNALTVFDDGTGPALFAGGEFTSAGGVAASNIAKWDGSQWSALGPGVGGPPDAGGVLALAVFDDGSGPALYVGGNYLQHGSQPRFIARWNGQQWSTVGGYLPMDGAVSALTVFDDGSGLALYAGGGFSATAEGILVNGIAKWNGTRWSRLGTGMRFGAVYALSVFDDGSGPALYAGGGFNVADDLPAHDIAKWDGTQWSAVGSGMNGEVRALTVFNDGSGRALHAEGNFTTAGGVTAIRIAKWNGAQWSALGSGITGGITYGRAALSVFDDGSGPALYSGGYFTRAGGVVTFGIAKWRATQWARLSGGNGIVARVAALTAFDDGTGPALYAGGEYPFRVVDVDFHQIAKWNGTEWSPLGSGVSNNVQALTVFDDGTGPALYAGGDFFGAGGVIVNSIAKWNGVQWSPLGSGMELDCDDPYYCDAPLVSALTVFDDGSGPALYAGGNFTRAGNVIVNSIAKWNGTQWSALGSGINGTASALAVFDDGSGPALYAGGGFTIAGDVSANRIAKWNGTQWSPLSSGMNNLVRALTVFDNGTGPALYAGGEFFTAGNRASYSIAAWHCP